MKFIEKNKTRLVINLFGFKMKFRKRISQEDLIKNLLYELSDPRTLEKIKRPKVLGLNESLRKLLEGKHSLARYGDGEFKLMMGESISFQKHDKILEKRLKQIIANNKENLLVGLPDVFGVFYNDYFRKVMINCRDFLYQYINFDRIYVDSMITRQLKFESEQQGREYFSQIKKLWQDKDVVIVEGEGSRLGVGNDLFANTNSINRILCPIKDAFSRYDEILAQCLEQSREKLFILALGPTATVLTADLSEKGYTALDVGHIDTMYECFLKKSDKLIHVEGKIVFNEERKKNKIPPCKDENYTKQIISQIK